jgi:ectoine hydroxylase-related dioxygenase (phytanoyl-CoA dioxygenase family)
VVSGAAEYCVSQQLPKLNTSVPPNLPSPPDPPCRRSFPYDGGASDGRTGSSPEHRPPGWPTSPHVLITSNGVAVPFDPEHAAPLTDSSALRSDPVRLRRRLADDGYLLLRQVLDRSRVLDARQAYFARFDPSYLADGTGPRDGIFSGHRPDDLGPHGTVGHPAHDFVRSGVWHELVTDPVLTGLATDVLGGPSDLLPRQIVRQFDRSSQRASRAHVDHTYLDAGVGDVVTMWVPLGDCPVETGPLVYLEDSHRMDGAELDTLRSVSDRPDDHRPLSHDLGWVADRSGRRWRWADFRAGDVAIHSPHIVHASLDVCSDAMRLSADIRFLRRGGIPDPRWLAAWSGDDGN